MALLFGIRNWKRLLLVAWKWLQPTQISLRKTQAMLNFSNLFSKDNEKDKEEYVEIQQLYAQIGKLQAQNEFLKKKL